MRSYVVGGSGNAGRSCDYVYACVFAGSAVFVQGFAFAFKMSLPPVLMPPPSDCIAASGPLSELGRYIEGVEKSFEGE